MPTFLPLYIFFFCKISISAEKKKKTPLTELFQATDISGFQICSYRKVAVPRRTSHHPRHLVPPLTELLHSLFTKI